MPAIWGYFQSTIGYFRVCVVVLDQELKAWTLWSLTVGQVSPPVKDSRSIRMTDTSLQSISYHGLYQRPCIERSCLGRRLHTLGLQIAQSRSYLYTLGPEVGNIYILGALGIRKKELKKKTKKSY